ncbi:MAG: hypothetical protein DME24_18820 [Verrucomicrobia bacterium]|nr:MAG: hypothetical protein DME24_18820 [Verrucomicrobiota bacterium]
MEIMDDKLQILLVDDNPDDRALVMREISREFPDSQFEQATNSKELAQAIESRRWDLVVTDYQLRWTDGVTVLLAVKVQWRDCPVIMFTGTGSEEVAVQAMKAGLDDYVIKSPKHYVRLPAAAHLALERTRQRLALREAEGRYQSLFDDVPVGLFRVALDGRIVDANPALMVYRHDGKLLWAEVNARAIHNRRNPVLDVLCYEGSLEDITERKRVEKKLRDSREQLRALAAYLQSVREEERTRIAREVHDELGQTLTALKMDLAWLDKKMAEANTAAALRPLQHKTKTLPVSVDQIISMVRKIATELRPPVLDELGLEAAIEWQIREFEKRTGIECQFKPGSRHLNLDPERATAVFRIFQETLTNIIRHAQATQVNIHLREEGDKLILEVQDNGRGLTGRERSGTRSLGLLGMRERATMLDGEINIIGRQGKGTTVGVRIPLHHPAPDAKK